MKKAVSQKLKVIYEYIHSDPADEKKVRHDLDRVFDMIFEIVLKDEADKKRQLSNNRGVVMGKTTD